MPPQAAEFPKAYLFMQTASIALMQRHGGDRPGNLVFAPGLDRAWRIERRGDISAPTSSGEHHAASLIGHRDFPLEHEHAVLVEWTAPERCPAHPRYRQRES